MAVTKYSALERFAGIRNKDTKEKINEAVQRAAKQERAAEEAKTVKVQSAYQKATTPTVDFAALTRGLVPTAKKEHADYVNSGEAKEKSRDALDRAIQMVLSGGGSVADAPLSTFQVKDTKEQKLKVRADYYEQQAQAAKDNETLRNDLAELESWPEEDKAALEIYIIQRNQQIYGDSEPSFENADYNARALFDKYGAQRVKELAESYQRSQNAANTLKAAQAGQEGAGSSTMGAIGHSALSVGANILGSVTSPLGYLGELGQRTGRYQTLDPNNVGNLPSAYSGAVREQVAKNIEGDGGALRKAGSYLYQGGMSMADSMLRLGLGGGASGAARLAAAGSLGQGIGQYSAQGANPMEAVTGAAAQAGLEYLTEKIPMDELLKAGKAGAKTLPEALKAAGKQALSEAITEEASLFGTKAAENVILGEKSAYNQRVAQLVAEGVSIADAQRQANREFGKEVLDTGIVSAISGGMSSAGQSVGLKAVDTVQKLTGDNVGKWVVDAAMGRKPGAADTEAQVKSPSYEELSQKKDIKVLDIGRNTEGKSYAQLKADVLSKATEQKWFDEPHMNVDTGLPIFVNKQSFTHAFSNLRSNFGTDTILTMGNLPELINNAVLTQADQPKDPRKAETNVYTFFAAVNGENGVEPVKLTVKEYSSRTEDRLPQNVLNYFRKTKQSPTYNKLYDVKALEVIGIESAKKEFDASASGAGSQGLPGAKGTSNSTIKVTDLLDLVKGDAEKYIPKSAKKEANVPGTAPDNGQTPSLISASEGSVAENGAVVNSDSARKVRAEDSVGAAPLGFGGDFTRMQFEYGNLPSGENPVRPDDMPLSTNGTDRVSQSAVTVKGAQATPDEFVDLLEEKVVGGGMSYIPITNNETVQKAFDSISKQGWNEARVDWAEKVRSGQSGADLTATGALLLNNAAKAGDKKAWLNILDDYRKLGTNTAQGLQAFRILKTLAPDDQLYMMERSVDQMVKDMHLQTDITIDEDLKTAYREAEDSEAKDKALKNIQKDVASQIPSTFSDKWTALRYLNMLGNFRTQMRNITGNLGNRAAYMAKDEIAAALETVASAVSGGKFQRTKSVTVSKGLKKAAAADFDNVKALALDGGKYNDSGQASTEFAQGVQNQRRIFKSPVLEGYRKATNWAMNNQYFGDEAFSRSAYARALAGYLQVNGVRGNFLEDVDNALLDKARAYAIQEAQEATFRDNNMVSEWISKIGRRKDTPKAARAIAEGVMPFRKTPANVLVRAEEFSPLGFINSAVKTVQAAQGKATGAEVINSWAKSLTGTGLFILGAALGDMGYLVGGPDEDEDKQYFDELNGYQNYALQLPDGTNLTFDFLSPSAMPMFLGAQMQKIIAEGGYSLKDFEQVFTSLADPMIEMSMLQGVNDTIDAIKYSDNNLGQFLMNATMSYLTQGLTNTLLGQIERSAEDSRMTTYVDKNSATPAWLQRQLGKISQKVPGWDYQQTKYRNAWGEEEKNPEGIADWLYNLLSPSYVDKVNVDAVAQELYRLNELQSDVNVFPDSPESTLTYKDKNGNTHENYSLPMEDYEKLQAAEGQTQARIVAELVNSQDYKALTDDQKAKAVSLAYEYAREHGRVEAIADYKGYSDSWMEGIAGMEASTIVNKVASASFSDAFTSLTTAWNEGYDESEAIGNLEEAYEVYKGMSAKAKAEVKNSASGRMGYYLKAREKGVDTAVFVDLYRQYYELDQSEKTATEKAADWAYTLQKAQEKGAITEKQKNALKNQMVFMQMFPAETEKFDQLTESGLSAKQAQDLGWLLKGLKPQEGYTNVRPVQQAEAIAKSTLSEADKISALKIYGSDAQDENLGQMLAMGFDAADYVVAWLTYANESGTGKKARTIAQYQEKFGVDYATAKAIYEIYG